MNHLLEQLEQALAAEGGAFTLADVNDAVRDRRAQVWDTEHAVLVTEVQQAPRRKILHFWLAAGDLDEVLRLSEIAIQWGREQGCTLATLNGRRGWEKVLANRGWTSRLTMMGRVL